MHSATGMKLLVTDKRRNILESNTTPANAFNETDHSYLNRNNTDNTTPHLVRMSEGRATTGGVCPTGSTAVRKQDEQLLQRYGVAVPGLAWVGTVCIRSILMRPSAQIQQPDLVRVNERRSRAAHPQFSWVA